MTSGYWWESCEGGVVQASRSAAYHVFLLVQQLLAAIVDSSLCR